MKSNISDVDMDQLLKGMCNARDAICRKGGGIVLDSKMEDFKPAQCSSQNAKLSVVEVNSQVRAIINSVLFPW